MPKLTPLTIDGTPRPKIGALVLAAGASSRFGHPKQLVAYRGEPLVRRAAAAALAAGAAPVVVVLGAHAAAVAPALAGLPGLTVMTHEGWAQGLASSLGAGIRALTAMARCDGVLITLADQPLVDATALRALVAVFDDTRRIVAAEYGGAVGVPALIGQEHLHELLQLSGDAGAGRWLRARLPAVTRVPVPGAAVDVDTLDDLGRL
jgi:CTP:molybdopterin cytidylyltransferase MocA